MNKKDGILIYNGQAIISILPEDPVLIDKNYLVALINKSKGYTVTKIRVGESGSEIKLLQPVNYNCDYDDTEKCYAAIKYEPIGSFDCDDNPFDLYVFAQTDNFEKPSGWAGPIRIKPTCKVPGEVICLDLK